MIAFREDPTLASYLRVSELAGESWPEYRGESLEYLRQNHSHPPAGPVEIFLYERLIGDAITVVEKSPSPALIGEVAEAAVETHPDWVISSCRRQAEEIMCQGRSKHYSEAVSWLKKVRAAYLAAGRESEWQGYLGELTTRHQRKYKLRPMLQSLYG